MWYIDNDPAFPLFQLSDVFKLLESETLNCI